MADKSVFDFSQFVPGFDFLKGLIPGSSVDGVAAPQAGGAFGNWLAPTLDSQEVQKRIDELKTVQFWLEQNGRALGATIQALEVQKLTLDTLKGMNTGVHEMAQVFKDGVAASAESAVTRTETADKESAAQAEVEGRNDSVPADLRIAQAQALQWWGALSEQFQTIASHALDDLSQNFAAASESIPGLKTSSEQAVGTAARNSGGAGGRTGKKTAQRKTATKAARTSTASGGAGRPKSAKPVAAKKTVKTAPKSSTR